MAAAPARTFTLPVAVEVARLERDRGRGRGARIAALTSTTNCARTRFLATSRDAPQPWEHHLAPSPIAVTTKGPLSPRVFQVCPLSQPSADVAGIELERLADGHEREGTVRVVGVEPGLDLQEEAARSCTLAPRPSVERQDSVGQNRDLEALLGLNPGPSTMRFMELGRQYALRCEFGFWKLHGPPFVVSLLISATLVPSPYRRW